MPKRKTAKLLNVRGQVTEHVCIRMEKRGTGRRRGIFPIYKCTVTGEERSFGYLACSEARMGELREWYPGAPLEIVEPGELGPSGTEFAG